MSNTVPLVAELIEKLNQRVVEYCHWKSNCRLDEVFTGETDIDLLIGQGSIGAFHHLIYELNFKLVELPDTDENHSVDHFYGYDDATGLLVHVHVYYRVITGGSVLKNYHLPIEGMLLEETGQINGLKVPRRSAELALFVIRKMIEHGTLVEWVMVRREIKAIRNEIDWLLGDDPRATLAEGETIIGNWLPSIEPGMIGEAIAALKGESSSGKLLRLAHRFRSALKDYRIHSTVSSESLLLYRFALKIYHRFVARNRTHCFRSGGLVIAVTGPEATGKSTLVGELRSWTGEHFTLFSMHAGKPPASGWMWLPSKLIPLARRAFGNLRTTNIETDLQSTDSNGAEKTPKPPQGMKLIVYSVRSLMIALQRRQALRRSFRQASRGAVVICDRYPSRRQGAMDSAQLDPEAEYVKSSRICSRIARIENHIYQTLPQPNIAIQLSVPVDIAIERNRTREKESEDENYVRRRHLQAAKQEYPLSYAVRIDTQQPLETSIRTIKRAFWSQV